MSKIVKYVALPLSGIVVIFAAIASYIAASFDPNQYKPRIVQAVKDATRRTLKLDGDIKLSFFPDIGATLGSASLSERASDSEFAGVDDFRLALKLMPLLSKQVVIDAIEVKNLRANLTRFKDGKFSIDDLTGGGDPSAPAARSEGPPVRIAIAQVTLENATITYFDQAEGAKYELSKFNLKTGRIANGVPGRIDLSFTAQSDKPRLNLETTLETTVSFDLDQRSCALTGLDLSAKGTAAGISNLAARAKGDVGAKFAGNEFLISKLAIAAAGRQEGGGFNAKLAVPRLAVTRDKVSGEKIALDATLNQAGSRIAARLDISGVDGNARTFTTGGLTASVEVRQDGAIIKAEVTSALAGSVETRKIGLSKLAAIVNVNNPKLLKTPFAATLNGSALVDIANQNASLKFAAKFDDSSVSGKAGLAKFAPPFYTFDLSIDQLDADRYLPRPDPRQKQPLDLSALKGFNASGSLKIGSLKMSNVKASNVRIGIND